MNSKVMYMLGLVSWCFKPSQPQGHVGEIDSEEMKR